MSASRPDAPAQWATSFVGLGSNLGDSVAIVRLALGALDQLPHTRLLQASRLYRTAPWGLTTQPDFINAVAMLHTGLSAPALLAAILRIERDAGRDRRADGSDRWGPRRLDLDLLLHAGAMIDEPGLRVPHPHLHERAFALLPLLSIAPDVLIPGIGPAHEALAKLPACDRQALTYADPPSGPDRGGRALSGSDPATSG